MYLKSNHSKHILVMTWTICKFRRLHAL